MAEEPKGELSPQPSPADTESSKSKPKSDGIEVISPPDVARRLAKSTIEGMLGVSVQQGPAAAIGAFGALPEAIQNKQLENDAESTKRSFDLEEKQLAAEEREREALRKHELEKRKLEIAQESKRETRNFWLLVGLLSVVCGIVVALFWNQRFDVGVPMVSGLLGLGAGFKGGESQGFKAAQREAAKSKETEKA